MTSDCQRPEFQDGQNSDNQPSDESLQEAQGGSFGPTFQDALMLPVRPFKNRIEAVTGELDKKSNIMAKTGQTSIGDALKWAFFPNSMAEKTGKGIDASINKRAEEQARLDDELG